MGIVRASGSTRTRIDHPRSSMSLETSPGVASVFVNVVGVVEIDAPSYDSTRSYRMRSVGAPFTKMTLFTIPSVMCRVCPEDGVVPLM